MPGALPSATSFSEQQVHDLVNIVHSVMQQYFAPRNQSSQTPPPSTPPSSTPPAPQETQKEEDEQQATVESNTESTTKHGSSIPDSKSTLSTIPRLEDSATCLGNALLLTCQHIIGYIEHSKDMEATGQG